MQGDSLIEFLRDEFEADQTLTSFDLPAFGPLVKAALEEVPDIAAYIKPAIQHADPVIRARAIKLLSGYAAFSPILETGVLGMFGRLMHRSFLTEHTEQSAVVRDLVIPMLRDPSTEVRVEAVAATPFCCTLAEGLELYPSLIVNADENVSVFAITNCRRFPDAQWLRLLKPQFESTRKDVQMWALLAASDCGGKLFVEEFLNAQSLEFRRELAERIKTAMTK